MAYKGGQYKPLSDKDVQMIHEGALKVLEETGVKCFTKTGREYFKKAGANVDDSTCMVKISRAMVEDAIASAPSSITLCGRDRKHDVVLENSNVHLGTGGTAINVLDLETGKRRPSTTEDVRLFSFFVDALENIHLHTINVYPNDVTAIDEVDVNRFYWAIKNTNKHIMGGIYSMQGLKDVIEMASMVAGGIDNLRANPFVSFITLIISPLKIDDIYGEMTCYICEQGLPVVVPTEPLCGATSPITMASNVMLHVAESLSGIVLTQVVNKGCPAIFGSVGSIVSMSTMDHLSGAIERAMINSAVSQMAQFYKLPYYSTAGMTDSKTVDTQAGYESGMSNLLVAMSGANYIHDAAGLMEFDLTASYEKLIIDDEIIGRVLRVLRGIEVNEETLALDIIKEIGAGGDFLGQEHTVKYMRTEFAKATVSDQQQREFWEAQGSPDTYQRAHAIALDILAKHKPEGIPANIDKAIREKFTYIRDAEKVEKCAV
ncbi:MAG: trimethylamine methyltransferase family protein [Armatimonadota bacterium]